MPAHHNLWDAGEVTSQGRTADKKPGARIDPSTYCGEIHGKASSGDCYPSTGAYDSRDLVYVCLSKEAAEPAAWYVRDEHPSETGRSCRNVKADTVGDDNRPAICCPSDKCGFYYRGGIPMCVGRAYIGYFSKGGQQFKYTCTIPDGDPDGKARWVKAAN